MTRETVFLEPPPADSSELEGFPAAALPEGERVWRVVTAGNGPWWFSSTMTGRFDLCDPRGTCYLAFDDLGAIMEVVGAELKSGVVSRGSLQRRRLRELGLPWDCELADCTSRLAASWVTSEIHTVVPYEVPQGWADAFDRVGLSGVLYRSRFDPSGPKAVALFGMSGANHSADEGHELEIDAKYEARLLEECGVVVEELPSFVDLSFVSLS